jgi:hypothetical protein
MLILFISTLCVPPDWFYDPLVSSIASSIHNIPPFGQSLVLDLFSTLPADGRRPFFMNSILLTWFSPALSLLVDHFAISELLTLLKSKNSTVAASSARLFCALATHHSVDLSFPWDGFSEASLNVCLHALACLDDEDIEFQACGTSILMVLMDHGMIVLLHLLVDYLHPPRYFQADSFRSWCHL